MADQNIDSRYQFGRCAEVHIKDFESQTKLVIGNDFEIEFDFFKTIDETRQASVGTIKIYGLKPSTVNSLQRDGGEVTLMCGYYGTEMTALFTAYISRMYINKTNNTTETTIECSANLFDYYFGLSRDNSFQVNVPTKAEKDVTGVSYNQPIAFILKQYASPEIVKVEFNFSNLSAQNKKIAANYLQLKTVSLNFNAVPYEAIYTQICDTFGLTRMTEDRRDGKVAIYSFTENGFNKAFQEFNSESFQDGIITRGKDAKNFQLFKSMFVADASNPTATVLTTTTGLISAKTEYKIATAYKDQDLASNEKQAISSSQKDFEYLKKEKLKEKKAKESEKEYKPSTKPRKIKINRMYQRVSALLNPLVRPQSIVAVEYALDDNDNVLFNTMRVREATYKGNNKNGDWVMDLYCEDSDGTNDIPTSEQDIANLKNSNSSEEQGSESEQVPQIYDQESETGGE